jgi:hypothetical protein
VTTTKAFVVVGRYHRTLPKTTTKAFVVATTKAFVVVGRDHHEKIPPTTTKAFVTR